MDVTRETRSNPNSSSRVEFRLPPSDMLIFEGNFLLPNFVIKTYRLSSLALFDGGTPTTFMSFITFRPYFQMVRF
jgi:hypothetical protein